MNFKTLSNEPAVFNLLTLDNVIDPSTTVTDLDSGEEINISRLIEEARTGLTNEAAEPLFNLLSLDNVIDPEATVVDEETGDVYNLTQMIVEAKKALNL